MQLYDNVSKEFPVVLDLLETDGFAVLNLELEIAYM